MGQGRMPSFWRPKAGPSTGVRLFRRRDPRGARPRRRQGRVSLDASVGRHEDFDFGAPRWDLILMSYTWVLRPPYLSASSTRSNPAACWFSST